LLLGVPHGAADLLVARNTAFSKNHKFSVPTFFAEYLSLIFAFALIFYFFPLIANLIFILLAAYHFGESDLHRYKVEGISGFAFQCFYGLFIIAAIILPNWVEAKAMISTMAQDPAQQHILTAIERYRFIILTLLLICMVLSSAYYLFKSKIPAKDIAQFVIITIVILLIVTQLPMLLAFTAYFVFWHSLRSIYHIISFLLKSRSVKLNRIISEMALYSVMAMIGVGILAIVSYGYADARSFQIYIFFGLAVLTAPHMRIMHKMKTASFGSI
jgi:Brp/Blh family beta-carotene 15,15'-monooxygenase